MHRYEDDSFKKSYKHSYKFRLFIAKPKPGSTPMTAFLRTVFLLLVLSNSLSAQVVSPPGGNSAISNADCDGPVFLKYYGRLSNTEYARDIVPTPANGSIAVGYAGNNDRSSDGLIMCLDSKGNVVWKK